LIANNDTFEISPPFQKAISTPISYFKILAPQEAERPPSKKSRASVGGILRNV
jgi:hypothetical protein